MIPDRPAFLRTYDLHGLRLALHAAPSLGEPLDAFLRALRAVPVEDEDAPDVRLVFESGAGAIPEDAEALGMHERGVEAFEAGDRIFLRYGASVAALDPRAGTASARIDPNLTDEDTRRGLLFDFLILSLLALLRPHGLYLLHAACLVRGGAGLLLSARSGSGKSTLAMSLVHEGWRYLSDDILLLRERDGVVEALGMGRHFRLIPDALERFPDLAARITATETFTDKHHLDVDALFPGRYTPHTVPRVLVIPEIADRPVSELSPLPPSAALLHMLGQTTFLARDARLADRHLATLRTLALQMKTYRLKAGRDLYDEPARASDLLAPLLDAGPTPGG
ncbi:hypothetical protein [Rhodocaloribacter sp.]